MRIQTKTVIELSIKELGDFQDFFTMLEDDENLSTDAAWDIMRAISNEDNEILNQYGYYLDIK